MKAIEWTPEPGLCCQIFAISRRGRPLTILSIRPLNQFVGYHALLDGVSTSSLQHNSERRPSDISRPNGRFSSYLYLASISTISMIQVEGETISTPDSSVRSSLYPLVITKMFRSVLWWARRRGIRTSAYLDDPIVKASAQDKSTLHLRLIQGKMEFEDSLWAKPNHPWNLFSIWIIWDSASTLAECLSMRRSKWHEIWDINRQQGFLLLFTTWPYLLERLSDNIPIFQAQRMTLGYCLETSQISMRSRLLGHVAGK